MSETIHFTIPEELHGARLDAALSKLFANRSLRECRRLFTTHHITCNHKTASKGDRIAVNDNIMVSPRDTTNTENIFSDPQSQFRIIEENTRYAALEKPGRIHSARIAGKMSASLEDALPSLFPATQQACLVNRLDYLTSGIVLVAKSTEAAEAFRGQENRGAVEKLYLTVVHGHLTAPVQIRSALDTAKRKTTRVLSTDSENPMRYTTVLPLRTVLPAMLPAASPATLLLCTIHKGARHQIRAHLASIHHPIIGDPLYGPEVPSSNTPLYLHHYQIDMNGFTATCSPPWDEWPEWSAT